MRVLDYSAASADSASASNEPECEPSPSAKSTPIAGASSPSTGQMSLFSETSRALTAEALADAVGVRQLQSARARVLRAGDGLATSGFDVICGGFPCQDISVAGKGAGIDGARSGLWSEYARIIGEVRPRYVIVENVAALLGRGLERVLGDLAALGYDAEWHCIPASAVGAPHRRDRVWIVAHAAGAGWRPERAQATEKRTGGRACGEPRRTSDDSIDGRRQHARCTACRSQRA